MSKIKIFALGGLGENGKNMYCVEIDEDSFIFDCGLKYDSGSHLGIDRIIPDFKLLESLKNIRGIFISHAHLDNFGALPELVSTYKIPVYTTKFTKAIIESYFKEFDLKEYEIKEIEPYRQVKFGKTNIFPFRLTHSMPDTLGFSINTVDGSILYTPDFIFDQHAKNEYQMDIGKIAYIGKKGVLALLSETISAENQGHTSPKHRITPLLTDEIIKASGRIFITLYSSSIYRLQEVLDLATKFNKKVALAPNSRFENIFTLAQEYNFINFDKKNLITYEESEKHFDSLVIITDKRDNPFGAVRSIIENSSSVVKFNNKDTVIIASPAISGNEVEAAKVNDLLYRTGARIKMISRKQVSSQHASAEDLLLMINLTNPKYLIPIKGEYRHQLKYTHLAKEIGYEKERIHLCNNGDVLTFVDGEFTSLQPNKVLETIVDTPFIGSNEIGDFVLNDRRLLQDDGIVTIAFAVNKQTKELITGPEIVSRGFIYVKDNFDLINSMGTIIKDVLIENTEPNYIDWIKTRKAMKDKCARFLYEQTERRPIIIIVAQEIIENGKKTVKKV